MSHSCSMSCPLALTHAKSCVSWAYLLSLDTFYIPSILFHKSAHLPLPPLNSCLFLQHHFLWVCLPVPFPLFVILTTFPVHLSHPCSLEGAPCLLSQTISLNFMFLIGTFVYHGPCALLLCIQHQNYDTHLLLCPSPVSHHTIPSNGLYPSNWSNHYSLMWTHTNQSLFWWCTRTSLSNASNVWGGLQIMKLVEKHVMTILIPRQNTQASL